LFEEDTVIVDKLVNLIYNLVQKCGGAKDLIQYVKEKLHKFIELSKSVTHTGCNIKALKIIEVLHHMNPSLKILSKDYMVTFLEGYAPMSLFYGLHAGIEVFYQSLYSSE
jgi:hypothetical protein